LLPPIAAYYCAFDPRARRASRDFLARVHRIRGDEPPGLRETYRHFLSFADAILDRLALWSGAVDAFEVVLHGREQMQELVDRRESAILVGAHLGSFDMLRVVAREADIPVNAVMYVDNAAQINEAFEALDPQSRVRVIGVEPNSAAALLEIRRCVARREFVAILADRVGPQASGRLCHASFLGDSAPFPLTPFLLAALLEIPVILTLALKAGPGRYDVYLERLPDAHAATRRDREKQAAEQARLFASTLERHCLRAPLQWFNFYDFWADAEHGRR
jgi:predicted LPLAT superfamily acyltransferase